jgi:hypothetical protein
MRALPLHHEAPQEREQSNMAKPSSSNLPSPADVDTLPWRDYVTRPITVQALEVGKDLQIEGIPEGDFIIKNPDPLEQQFGGILHCPREDFLEHYSEVQ